jgi:hypothetical protein
MSIYINQVRGKLVARVGSGETETIQLATANAAATETVNSMMISKIIWSGNTTVSRGSNTLFTLTGNGNWDLDVMGIAHGELPTANIVIAVAAGGTALVEIKKASTLS